MSIDEYITSLRKQHNIIVTSDNGELKIKARQESLTREIVDDIRSRKPQIIDFFRSIEENKKTAQEIPLAGNKPWYRLSSAQSRMYFMHQLDRSSLAYNMPVMVKLTGAVDKAKIANAFIQLTQRHESLRTYFEVINGEPVQKIAPHVTIEVEQRSSTDGFVKPFNLAKAPLMRAALVEINATEYILMVDMHHIITDGMSIGLLMKEFMLLYNGNTLPEVKLQYKDFSEWQQSAEQQEKISAQKDFWRNQFAEETQLLDLPADFERKPVRTYAGSSIDFDLDANITAKLRSLAEKEGCTMFMLLLSIYNILLSKLSNQEDIVVGSSLAGRNHADLDGTIGMFVNTIPLRNYPKGELSFREFLADLRSRTIACFRNQACTYSELIDELKIQRISGRNPFFDVMFDFQNFIDGKIEIPGLVLSPYENDHAISKFDCTLTAMESQGMIRLHLEYSTELFKKETIENFIVYFKRIVSAVIDEPSQLIKNISLIDATERRQLIEDFNSTTVAYNENETVLDLFRRQVANTPDSNAIIFETKSFTYRQVDELSNQLANCLRSAHSIQPGERVAIQLDRNEWMVVSILGVLKAGGAYVPIDPAYPSERKKHIVTDAGVRLLITETYYMFELDYYDGAMVAVDVELGTYDTNFEAAVAPAGLAYVIYTSGSTGKPKGVMIEHGSLYNYISWARDQYLRGEKSDLALYTSIAFDLTVTSVFTPLVTGNSIIVYKENDKDLVIEKVIADNKADIIKLTPSHLKVIAASKFLPAFTGKKKFIVGGEQLDTQLAKDVHTKLGGNVEIFNEYGPTEATVGCMIYRFNPENNSVAVPIGRPAANTQIYVFDKYRNPVPKGVVGEIYIGGKQVARGYINNESLTKERFIDGLYKTGDQARMLATGDLEFIGRTDEQVKIRGHRIELGEIESTLQLHEDINDVAVIAKEGKLIAYVTASNELQTAKLTAFLSERLPQYMVPAHFVQLEKLPLTINGKLDKRALPEPEAEQDNYVAPANEKEELLADIWSKVLGIERVGTNDNFFLLGGDSIKSIQISSRLLGAGFDVPVKDIFAYKTIRELAPQLKEVTNAAGQSVITGKAPLTPIQRWYFEGAKIDPHYFNHSLMLNFADGITEQTVRTIFGKILEHHDVLRMVFRREGEQIMQHNLDMDLPLSLQVHDVREQDGPEIALTNICNEIQSGLDLENGPLMKLGLFHLKNGSRLLIVIHHLVVDGVSWRILLEDVDTLYKQVTGQQPLVLPLKTDSYLSWANYLSAYKGEREFNTNVPRISRDIDSDENTVGISTSESFKLSKEETSKLLTSVHFPFNTQINDILLTAFLMAVHKHYGLDAVMVDMESHGRTHMNGINVSRTIGWFTTIYPVVLEMKSKELSNLIRFVKEALRSVPNNGLEYLLNGGKNSQISFNYLGQFDTITDDHSYALAKESKGQQVSKNKIRDFEWDVLGIVTNGELEINLSYSPKQYYQQTINALLQHFQNSLRELIAYCSAQDKKILSPSDLACSGISMETLDALQQKYDVENIYSLSPMQEGILFHSLFDPSSNNYFEQLTYSVKGSLDLDCIERSMNAVIARYDVLRTCFLYESGSKPLQLVLKNKTIELIYKNIGDECDASSRDEVINKYQEADKANKFDLASGSLMRLTVLQVDENKYEFIWSHHHIIMDGWCMQIIINEFSTLYAKFRNGKQVNLPDVIPYSHYIQWLQARDTEAPKLYWKNYLDGYDSLVSLPKKPSAENQPYQLSTAYLTLSADEMKLLQKVSSEHAVTINTIVQVAWGLLLSRYNNTDDVVFGSVVSGRPPGIYGIERMVGLFINTIPVRIRYNANESVAALMQQVQRNALESDHQQYFPLSEIQSQCEAGRALLDHIIVFENFPMTDAIGENDTVDRETGYKVSNLRVFEQTNYDLALMALPHGEQLEMKIDFNANHYDAAMIEQVLARLHYIITQFTQGLDLLIKQVKLASPIEEECMLRQFNDTAAPYPANETIISLFEQQVEKTPGNTACRFGEISMTYAELNARANQFARWLQLQQVSSGDMVGVMLERSEHLIPLIYGVLKAGAAYVPIDPHYPAERVRTITESAKLKLLVDKNNIAHDIILSQDAANLGTQPGKYDLAYVIYTSGSTGKPKGVMIEHHSVVNRLWWMNRRYHLSDHDVILQKTPTVFDVSVWELFWWSFTGASLALLQPGEEKEPAAIIDAIEKYGVTTMHFVPSMLSAFLSSIGDDFDYNKVNTLRQVFASGEALKPEQVNRFGKTIHRHCNTALINLYGPTEATVDVSYYDCTFNENERSIPIGKPIYNTKLYVLDCAGQLAPIGVPGELCIAGVNLARGYVNDEMQTNQKFVANPFAEDERMYRTGDLVRWLEDGNIEYLDRIDNQVKIRGFRIELGEIENVLQSHEDVNEAAVIAKNGELIAYITTNNQSPTTAFKSFLSERLPYYMIPSHFVVLDSMPLSVNGKLNRKALPDPAEETAKADASTVAEKILSDIWFEVLHRKVSIDDDFFKAGGHSIRAINLINAIYGKFGIKLRLRDVFEHTTIRKQALLLEAQQKEQITIPHIGERDSYPASSAQERLFFEYLQDKQSLAYNISAAYEIEGELDIERMSHAFQLLINRHEALRTSFVLSGDGVMQKIHPSLNANIGRSNTITPFDLEKAPLIRFSIEKNILLVDVHHIVCDGISLNILMNDFKNLYLGNELPQLPLRYADYAAWQKSSDAGIIRQEQYWKDKLAAELPPLELPRLQDKDTVDIRPAGVEILEAEDQNIKQFAAEHGVSDFMLLLSVYYILLSRITGNGDIVIGADVAGRTQPALKNIVGSFINILPLRVQIDQSLTYADLLSDVKNCVLEAFENQDFQYDRMCQIAGKPLADVHFAFANFFESTIDIDSIRFVPVTSGAERTTQYEFKIEVAEQPGRFIIQFIYSKALYDAETIKTFARYYYNILQSILSNPRIVIEAIRI